MGFRSFERNVSGSIRVKTCVTEAIITENHLETFLKRVKSYKLALAKLHDKANNLLNDSIML